MCRATKGLMPSLNKGRLQKQPLIGPLRNFIFLGFPLQHLSEDFSGHLSGLFLKFKPFAVRTIYRYCRPGFLSPARD